MTFLVYNVGRGLCVSVTSPSGLLLMIDCGKRPDFSPVRALAANSKFFTPIGGFPLACLVITHPHSDHLAAIDEVSSLLPPYLVVGRNDLDWSRVMAGGIDKSFVHYYLNYLPPMRREVTLSSSPIDWGGGMTVSYHWLHETTAQRISSSDNSYVNNTSIVTVIKYKGYVFAVLGDIETDGIRELLRQGSGLLFDLLFGVDFLVASHHGHPSGFASEWFALPGPTRRSTIVSERSRKLGENQSATQVDARYSKPEFSLALNRENRRMVSTRTDGSVRVQVHGDGKWSWSIRN